MAPIIFSALKSIGESVLVATAITIAKEAASNPEKVAEVAVDAVGNAILAPLEAASEFLDFLNEHL